MVSEILREPGPSHTLFDVLAAKEKEKRETRKAQRDVKGAEVERDW